MEKFNWRCVLFSETLSSTSMGVESSAMLLGRCSPIKRMTLYSLALRAWMKERTHKAV